MADTEQQDNTYGNDEGMTMPTNVEPSQTGSSGGTSESALRIQQLHAVEKQIVQLIQTAGNAIGVLSDKLVTDEATGEQYVQERAAAFANESRSYYALLKEIQRTLREHVSFLAKSGILTQSPNKTVPFHASVYAEQKELELWVSATQVIRAKVEEIVAVANKSDLTN
ncbi:hypothetical protein BGW37DRAFT_76088 [Umbelopsis sp. PMI_123]|nr:hypothetical protein BGW37DRAFT_76088 [Umbelopsis sp. PMI_123]